MRHLVCGRHAIHHAANPEKLFVMPYLRFLTRGRERDFLSIAAQTFEKLTYFRERLHVRQVFFLENLPAVFVGLFAKLAHLLLVKKLRQILIAAFADLFAQAFKRNVLVEMPERIVPREDMELV